MIDLFFIGVLSAYAMNPTVGTVELRQEWGQLPQGNLYDSHILVAVNDCGLIGETGTLTIGGERQPKPAMVFDCKGAGNDWMSASNSDTPFKVAAEVDYFTWISHPHWVGGDSLVAVLEFGGES